MEKIKSVGKNIYMRLCNKVLGVTRNRIVFKSFGGKTYSDNPRAISETLHRTDPSFEIIWIFKYPQKKKKIVPDYVKVIKANSFHELRAWATSKFWIDNFTKPAYFYKSKSQVYIQTMHGDRGLKKILYDSPFISSHIKYIENNICDLGLSSSNYGDKIFKTGLLYNGQLLGKGSPRNDKLIENNKELVDRLKKQFKISPDTKILFYAPTLRRKSAKQKEKQIISQINLQEVLAILEEKTKKKWICFTRAHSSVVGLSGIPENSERFFDMTDYEDMSDLLLIADFLITDYSSSAGDFALMRRPIILFQNDREEYLKEDRDFYFDLDISPYLIAKNQHELKEIVSRFDINSAKENCEEILDFYDTVETGRASEEVCRYIISKR